MHPLARGLIGLYVLGGSKGLVDLCNIGPPLVPFAAGAIGTTQVGAGLICNLTSSGAQSATRPTQYELASTNMSVVHYGLHTTAATGSSFDTPYVGSTSATATAPYHNWALAGTVVGTAIEFEYNTSGSYRNVTATQSQTIGLHVTQIVFGTGGGAAYTFYRDGISIGTGTLDANPFSFSVADARLVVGCFDATLTTRIANTISLAAMIYNTGSVQMSADIAAWLAQEPFAMLRPVSKRVYSMASAAPTGGSHLLTTMGVGGMLTPAEVVTGAAGAALLRNPRINRRRIITGGFSGD